MLRELPECTADADVEWRLFKANIASSGVWVCRRKLLSVTNNGKKLTPQWNQEEKDVIQAKKVTYEARLQDKADSSLQLRYAEVQKSAALTRKSSKSNLGRTSDVY